MITLREMHEEEFHSYIDVFVPDYADEIVANYGTSHAQAVQKAQNTVATSLPQGTATKGQELLCILLGERIVGYFWYSYQTDDTSIFIQDFYILDDFRGKGYGREAMQALEAHVEAQGVGQIGLRVAADNKRAQHLYVSGGFRITGINMTRQIGGR